MQHDSLSRRSRLSRVSLLRLLSSVLIVSLLLVPAGAFAAPDSHAGKNTKIDFTLTLLQNNDG